MEKVTSISQADSLNQPQTDEVGRNEKYSGNAKNAKL